MLRCSLPFALIFSQGGNIQGRRYDYKITKDAFTPTTVLTVWAGETKPFVIISSPLRNGAVTVFWLGSGPFWAEAWHGLPL